MKTKIITLLLALFAIATAQAQFGGGNGTEENPYIISTTDHMTTLANNVNDGNKYRGTYFRLDADLDFTGKNYTIIGGFTVNINASFNGNFNGDNHTISGVTIDMPLTTRSQQIGLFGQTESAVIENLTLSNSTIRGFSDVGGIVGYGGSTIRNCHVTSSVTIESNSNSGGIVGLLASYSSIVGCTSAATISGIGNLGGITGRTGLSGYNEIENCAYVGTISGTDDVGGIVGWIANNNTTTLTACYTGGACTTGAVGVEGSTQGTDEGYDVTRIYSASINTSGIDEGTFVSQPIVADGTEHYYTPGSVVALSGLYTSGNPAGTGSVWGYRANKGSSIDSDHAPLLPQGDGTWLFTMPAADVTINSFIARGLNYGINFGFTPHEAPYTGEPQRPTITRVHWNGYTLTEGTDYITDLPSEGFTEPGNHPIRIWGIGAYSGLHTETFTIMKLPLTQLTLSKTSTQYDGEAHKPVLTVKSDSKTLARGTEYETDLPAAGFTEPGDYTIRVWGIGTYEGELTATFTITKAPLTSLAIAPAMVYHDGEAHTPTLTVKAGSKTLARGTEYETDLPDGGFTDLGDYMIKVWGVGHYTDTLSATFTVRHPWDGKGTEREPFLIQSTDDMDRLAALVNGGNNFTGVYFEQTADLDYAGKTYTPVGKVSIGYYDEGSGTEIEIHYYFNGTFSSPYGFKILNVTTPDDRYYAGVFGIIGPQGIVQGVTLGGVGTISGNASGGIAGENWGSIVSCSVDTATVSIIGSSAAGGIVGMNCAIVQSCESHASVGYGGSSFDPDDEILKDYHSVGGIAGFCRMDSHVGLTPEVSGTFHGHLDVYANGGGLVGINFGQVYGNMHGTIATPGLAKAVGGLVGWNFAGVVSHSLSTCLMTDVEATQCGAIVGENLSNYEESGQTAVGVVENCYYIGACRYGGINGADVPGQAMRGWMVSAADGIFIQQMPDEDFNMTGITYDGIAYLGAGQTGYFNIQLALPEFMPEGYTVSAGTLTPVSSEYFDDYYALTMPSEGQNVTISLVGEITLELLDNDLEAYPSNANRISTANGQTVNVKLQGRTLYKTGIWNTICLPFALSSFARTPLADATVKELVSSGYNASTGTLTLNFSTVSEIEAGKPYIVRWASGENVENPVFNGVTVSSNAVSTVETDYVDFIGCYSPVSLAAQDRSVLYLGDNSKLYYPSVEVPVNAFRGHFRLKNSLTAGDLPTNGAKNIVLNFGDETTGLTAVESGQLRVDSWYSIDGKKLQGEPTKKGVYITKGKKVKKEFP